MNKKIAVNINIQETNGDEDYTANMDEASKKLRYSKPWRLENYFIVIIYIFLFIIQSKCQTVLEENSQTVTKRTIDSIEHNVDSKHCHSCQNSSNKHIDLDNQNERNNKDVVKSEIVTNDLITTLGTLAKNYLFDNKTSTQIEEEIEEMVDSAMSKDKLTLFDGIEIKTDKTHKFERRDNEGRALFPKYSKEYRLYQKIKTFMDTYILSINLPKAAELVGFRSFGLKKFFLPLLIGAQVFKSILLAMFLPSLLGSFGKILGKGLSTLSASSSQASYPPANQDEQGYSDIGYDNGNGMYAYPQDGLYANMADANEVNELSDGDMSRFTASGQKVSYLPVKNNYYKNQVAAASNNYKVFQKIPASSMILNNYDPFYSPLLSRLDGIFARLGLAPSDSTNPGDQQIGGQSLNDVKLESCREQLICLMYGSPAKYAPYSNLVSAQLSRELNELRRPVSDNPEILRFFRYMRAARRGQEGADCMRAFPACSSNAAPAHTMIAAYHDINKLVTARKLRT